MENSVTFHKNFNLLQKKAKCYKKASGKAFTSPLVRRFFIQKTHKKYGFSRFFRSLKKRKHGTKVRSSPRKKLQHLQLRQRGERRNRSVRSYGRDGSCFRLRVPKGRSNRLRELRTKQRARNSSKERAVCIPWGEAYRCSCS